MTEKVNVDKNYYVNPNKTWTDDDGNEHFGVEELGYRDPDTHAIVFDDSEPVAAPQIVEAPEVEQVEVEREPVTYEAPAEQDDSE